MYTLYYSPGACSMAIHVLLGELGQDVKLINANTEGTRNRSPEFLKFNPRGTVPVLVDEGMVVREGAAIIIYLCDKHKSKLLPASGRERASALEWLMFCNATLHPAYARAFFALKNFQGDEQTTFITPAIAIINTLWKEVDARLADSPYLCGKEFSVADILLTVIANWSDRFPLPVHIGSNAKRLLKEISTRPAYQKALATEQVEYKAAA